MSLVTVVIIYFIFIIDIRVIIYYTFIIVII